MAAGWFARQLRALNRRPFGRAESAFYEYVAAPAVRRIVAPILTRELDGSGPRVLDVGCGAGDLTSELRGAARAVVGVDPSAAQLQRLRRNGLAVPDDDALVGGDRTVAGERVEAEPVRRLPASPRAGRKSSIEQPASPVAQARRTTAATAPGSLAKQSSRSAATGTSTADASGSQCASASSWVTWPSRRPRVAAKPLLVLAIASKPSDASSRAEPASQALGCSSGPSPWCSSRNRPALPCSVMAST